MKEKCDCCGAEGVALYYYEKDDRDYCDECFSQIEQGGEQ